MSDYNKRKKEKERANKIRSERREKLKNKSVALSTATTLNS